MEAATLQGLTLNRPLSFSASSFASGQNQKWTVAAAATASRPCPAGASRRFSLRIEAKGKKTPVPGMGARPQMAPPKIDPNDDNPKFVIFIRNAKVNLWYPLSIVDGGTAAGLIIRLMKFELGKKIYGNVLTNNIAQAVYRDEKGLRIAGVRQYPELKDAASLQYGYKILDPANPKGSVSSSNVIVVPPKEEIKSVLDKAKDFFSEKFTSIKEGVGNLSSLGSGEDKKP